MPNNVNRPEENLLCLICLILSPEFILVLHSALSSKDSKCFLEKQTVTGFRLCRKVNALLLTIPATSDASNSNIGLPTVDAAVVESGLRSVSVNIALVVNGKLCRTMKWADGITC